MTGMPAGLCCWRAGTAGTSCSPTTRTVLTIHQHRYQGEFPAAAVADLGLGDMPTSATRTTACRPINALKHGCMYADAITTVSPTYAPEIRTPEYGMGLQEVLRTRASALSDPDGVDYEDGPAHDVT